MAKRTKAKPELWVKPSPGGRFYVVYSRKPTREQALDAIETSLCRWLFGRLTGISLRKGQMCRISVKVVGKVCSAKTGKPVREDGD